MRWTTSKCKSKSLPTMMQSTCERVEQAIYHVLSLRPTVTVAKPGTLAHFELKARRFQRPQRTYENQQS